MRGIVATAVCSGSLDYQISPAPCYSARATPLPFPMLKIRNRVRKPGDGDMTFLWSGVVWAVYVGVPPFMETPISDFTLEFGFRGSGIATDCKKDLANCKELQEPFQNLRYTRVCCTLWFVALCIGLSGPQIPEALIAQQIALLCRVTFLRLKNE